MDKKAQASLEYLMTYGWALILIATVIGVLVFVIMAPTNMLIFSSTNPTKISLLGASSTGNNIEMRLQNITGGMIKITKITYTAEFSGGLANGEIIISGDDISPPIVIRGGGTLYIEDVTYGGGTAGGRVSIDYTDYFGISRNVGLVANRTSGSEEPPAEPSQPPTQPTLIDEPDGQPEGTVLLEWNISTDPESDPITYNLIVGTSSGTNDKVDADTTSLSYTSPSLTAGTYYWSVMACDDGPNCSSRSAEDSFTIVALPPPDGTPGNPFQIDDCAKLQAIDSDLTAYYILTSNVDCSGFPFDPIGDYSGDKFSGSLDGQGNSVIDLSISAVGEDNIALFVYIMAGGEVKNLAFTNATVVGRLQIGALVGRNYGTITNVSSSGNVTAKINGGGLVGENFGTIQNSSSSANIFPSPAGNNQIGGLVGKNDGVIIESYSTGTINPSSFGNQMGGLVGSNWSNGTIDRSYSTSTVNSTKSSTGGLAGDNFGVINDSYATGTVTGVDRIGGFIGKQADESITNSYSTGAVIESGTDFGGFAGLDGTGGGSSCDDSFWDTETSGEGVSACGATGKTTAEMQQQATFTNWDFATVWTIDEGNDYPRLQWEQAD